MGFPTYDQVRLGGWKRLGTGPIVQQGDQSTDVTIFNGRFSTGTAAGTTINIGADYTYGELWEVRTKVTSWTGVGSSFKGQYFRAEVGVDGAGKGLRCAEFYAVQNAGFNIDNLQAAYFEAGMKANGAVTVKNANAAEFSLSPYTGTGAITITNYWDAILLTPSGVSSRIDAPNAAKINGIHLLARDGDGGSTKLGDGFKMENDSSQSGTRSLTNGINMQIDATTGVLLAGATTTAMSVTGAFTTGLSIAADGTTAINITNAFSGTTGLLFAGTATDGVSITGACGDAIHVSGSNTATAINVSGTQAKGLEFTGTYSDHIIYIHPTSQATGKRAFRIGDYGTEFPVLAGDGIIRTYAKVTSGTDTTALAFHWGFTEGATTGALVGEQFQMESHSTTPGPKTVQVADFIAGIDASHFIAATTAVGEGLQGGRFKVYGDVTATCSGDVNALWLDSQMSCAVGGIEASILATTGGTVPDAFARFVTTSSGWANLLYFDALCAPVSTSATALNGITTSHKIAIQIGATTYYIPIVQTGMA